MFCWAEEKHGKISCNYYKLHNGISRSCSLSLCHCWHAKQMRTFLRIMGQKCSYYKSSYLSQKARKKMFSFYLASAEICMTCYLPRTPVNTALAYHHAFLQDIISFPWHVVSHVLIRLLLTGRSARVLTFPFDFPIHLGWAHDSPARRGTQLGTCSLQSLCSAGRVYLGPKPG